MSIPSLPVDGAIDAPQSAVSWAAIFAGGATAAGVSLLLLTLGSGLGFSSVSPWPQSGVTATTFAISSAIFLIFVQWIASAFGGYMAGRLRTRWTGVHTDEILFRDTAHGLLAWCVAALFSAMMVLSSASSIASGGARTAASLAGGSAQGVAQAAGNSSELAAYLTDGLLRSERTDATASAAEFKSEAGRILISSLSDGLPASDRSYLAQQIASRTGIPQADAEKRIDDAAARLKAAADKARATADEVRKAAAKLSFYLFFSMLIGAFISAASGALGGQLRDDR